MSMLDSIRWLFNQPTAATLAQRQLEETERQLLYAYAYREDADAMVKKYEDRLRRLEEATAGLGCTSAQQVASTTGALPRALGPTVPKRKQLGELTW